MIHHPPSPFDGPQSRRGRARHEFKYVLRPAIARRALDFIKPLLVLDPHGEGRSGNAYTVRSVYFDSPGFECVRAKLGGQRRREKHRLRTYNDPGSGPLTFELKRKSGMEYAKHAIGLDPRTVSAGTPCATEDWLPAVERSRAPVAPRIVYQFARKAYLPAALVTYEREAYGDALDGTTRVTLDRNVRARMWPEVSDLWDERDWTYPLGDWVIFEVKFTERIPRWVGSLHGHFQLNRQACSKYCTSVAGLLGEKPSSRKGFRYF